MAHEQIGTPVLLASFQGNRHDSKMVANLLIAIYMYAPQTIRYGLTQYLRLLLPTGRAVYRYSVAPVNQAQNYRVKFKQHELPIHSCIFKIDKKTDSK